MVARAVILHETEPGVLMYFSKPSKAIDVTAEILAQIERVTGTAVTADDIVVFEAAVANTRRRHRR